MLTKRQAKRLEPRVIKAALYLSRCTGMDDAEQEIWLGICEKARSTNLMTQKDTYIVQAGVFWARNEWRKRNGRIKRETPLEDAVHLDLPQDGYLRELMAFLSGDRIAKALVAGIVRGAKKKEIAQRAGVSPQSISAAGHRVRTAMETIGGMS